MPKRERADGHRRPAIRGRSFSQRNVRSHRKIGVCGKNAAQRAGARIANAAPLEEAAEHYRRYMAETSRDGLDCSPPKGVGFAGKGAMDSIPWFASMGGPQASGRMG